MMFNSERYLGIEIRVNISFYELTLAVAVGEASRNLLTAPQLTKRLPKSIFPEKITRENEVER